MRLKRVQSYALTMVMGRVFPGSMILLLQVHTSCVISHVNLVSEIHCFINYFCHVSSSRSNFSG